MEWSFSLTNLFMIIFFVVGYLLVTVEHYTKINKSGVVLLMAVVCWLLQFSRPGGQHDANVHDLLTHLGNISQVIFFILGALAIVEKINTFHGFRLISECVSFRSKRQLLWVIGFITFFLSSVLDNLTTTIIMISFLQKIIKQHEDRLVIGGAVVIAANAGGAWTAIGDVTTTMLWIGGQISALQVMIELFFPSLVCLVVSLFFLTFLLKGSIGQHTPTSDLKPEPLGNFMLFLGLGCLIFVPIFKMLTGLPPFMGVILGLAVMWLVSDVLNKSEDREHMRMPAVLSRIDFSGVLFFFGILMTVAAFEAAGILHNLAFWLNTKISNPNLVPIAIGLVSAVVDNIPLVAASMGMYELSQFPVDAPFWQLIAFCAGTGGSILIIGSAAGVAFLNMEKVPFFWYLRKIGFSAAAGYFAGIGAYLLTL